MTKYRRITSNVSLFGLVSGLTLAPTAGFAQDAAAVPAPAASATPVVEAAASTAVAVPTPAATPAVATAKSEETVKEPTASKLAVGEGGGLKVSGVVQVWGVFQHQTDIAETTDNASTARLRRAELKISGDLVPKKFSFGVMLDAAKTPKFGNAVAVTAPEEEGGENGTATVLTPAKDNSLLQDAYLTYSAPWFDLSAGQFKTPISYESATSSSKLLLPERAAVVRTYGEQRDVGVKLEKKYAYVGYVLGLFNGAGINRLDDNMQKDAALRLEAYPIKGLTLGAVGYTSLGQRDTQASTKDRLEGDLALQLGDLVVQGEYIRAWTGPTGTDARITGAGWYGTVGYTIAKVLQPVVRVGQVDPDVDVDDNAESTIEAGLNFFVLKDTVKLQLAYAHTGYQATGKYAMNDVTLAAQFKY